jgi:hypothetical protein
MLMQVQVALSNVEARALVSPLKTKRISDRTSRRKAISWAQHPTPQPRGARSRFADGDALTKPSIMNCLACDLSPNAILQHEEQKMRQQKQVSEWTQAVENARGVSLALDLHAQALLSHADHQTIA